LCFLFHSIPSLLNQLFQLFHLISYLLHLLPKHLHIHIPREIYRLHQLALRYLRQINLLLINLNHPLRLNRPFYPKYLLLLLPLFLLTFSSRHLLLKRSLLSRKRFLRLYSLLLL